MSTKRPQKTREILMAWSITLLPVLLIISGILFFVSETVFMIFIGGGVLWFFIIFYSDIMSPSGLKERKLLEYSKYWKQVNTPVSKSFDKLLETHQDYIEGIVSDNSKMVDILQERKDFDEEIFFSKRVFQFIYDLCELYKRSNNESTLSKGKNNYTFNIDGDIYIFEYHYCFGVGGMCWDVAITKSSDIIYKSRLTHQKYSEDDSGPVFLEFSLLDAFKPGLWVKSIMEKIYIIRTQQEEFQGVQEKIVEEERKKIDLKKEQVIKDNFL